MSEIASKFEELDYRLKSHARGGGVHIDNTVLLIYPPEEHFAFTKVLARYLSKLEHKGQKIHTLDLSTLPFEVLDVEDIEEDFRRELDDPRGFRQEMAGLLEEELVDQILTLSEANPDWPIFLLNPMSLFPWMRYSNVLSEIRNVSNPVVLPFPGTQYGARMHFLNQRDGFNYLATVI